jgi:hypothetical protein
MFKLFIKFLNNIFIDLNFKLNNVFFIKIKIK